MSGIATPAEYSEDSDFDNSQHANLRVVPRAENRRSELAQVDEEEASASEHARSYSGKRAGVNHSESKANAGSVGAEDAGTNEYGARPETAALEPGEGTAEGDIY